MRPLMLLPPSETDNQLAALFSNVNKLTSLESRLTRVKNLDGLKRQR